MSDDRAPLFFLPLSTSRTQDSSAGWDASATQDLGFNSSADKVLGGRTLFLLLLFLCSHQALTELLLLLDEAGSIASRDVGKCGRACGALQGRAGGKGTGAGRRRMGSGQDAAHTDTCTAGKHGEESCSSALCRCN